MNDYFLHRHAFFCLLDEGAVFLNTRRCDYIAVDAVRLAAIARQISGWRSPSTTSAPEHDRHCPGSARLLDELVRRELLTTSPRDGKPAVPPSRTAHRALPSTSYRSYQRAPRLRDALTFLVALTTVTRHLRSRDLMGILARIERVKKSRRVDAEMRTAPDIASLTRVFTMMRVWFYSADGACLKDSLVLTEFLLRCGTLPTFVMGVRSRPFAAHAWVQSADVVLNDSLENVERYTPILAI